MRTSRNAIQNRLQKLEQRQAELRERASAQPATMFNESKLRAIAKRYGLNLIVLFGSHAKGRARRESDIDVAVRSRNAQTFLRGDLEFRLASELQDAVNATGELDLVVLNRAESLLLREIATSGIPVFERDDSRWLDFVSYANRRFYDDEHYREGVAAYLRRRYL